MTFIDALGNRLHAASSGDLHKKVLLRLAAFGALRSTRWEDYTMMKFAVAAGMAAALMNSTAAFAVDLEVTHWWTSAGEAASIAEFARIFEEQTGNNWVDSALAGSGTGANPVIIGRILGGDPMGATQMNTGRDAEELIQAGPDARPHPDPRRTRGPGLLRRPDAARALHLRRQDLLLPDQHPLVGLAVALHQGLRNDRPAGSDQLERVRRQLAGP